MKEGEGLAQPAAVPKPASHSSPTDPVLRANPFPEVTDPICRLPLSTLFYFTRGCLPWRPDAVVGTARGVNNKTFPPLFKGSRKHTGHLEKRGALPVSKSYLQLNRFQDNSTVKKQRQRFPELSPASRSSFMLPFSIHVPAREY